MPAATAKATIAATERVISTLLHAPSLRRPCQAAGRSRRGAQRKGASAAGNAAARRASQERRAEVRRGACGALPLDDLDVVVVAILDLRNVLHRLRPAAVAVARACVVARLLQQQHRLLDVA